MLQALQAVPLKANFLNCKAGTLSESFPAFFDFKLGVVIMRLVESLEEIKDNIETIDNYLNKKLDSEYTFALKLIKKGVCFIVAKSDNNYKFYPSRFIGYANNTMSEHLNNDEKDGRETNPAISDILHQKCVTDKEMEREYKNYCEKLGFTANEKGSFGVERKYWKLF